VRLLNASSVLLPNFKSCTVRSMRTDYSLLKYWNPPPSSSALFVQWFAEWPHDRTGHTDSPSHTLVIDHGIRFFFFIASIRSIHLTLPLLESTVLPQIRFGMRFTISFYLPLSTSDIRSLLLLEFVRQIYRNDDD